MRTGSIGPIDLRVIARAGILPEITRQTYESLGKAVREAVMNAIDAGATVVHLDFSRADEGALRIIDDGDGMSLADLSDRFLALGGSERSGDADKFGRIGIGSFALLAFGGSVRVRTLRSGYPGVVAEVRLPPESDGLDPLDKTRLGVAMTDPEMVGPDLLPGATHFTEVSIAGLTTVALEEILNVSSYYDLLDDLGRLLPLRAPDSGHDLLASLSSLNPDVALEITTLKSKWSVDVIVHSPWHPPLNLARRSYGTNAADEPWIGDPHAIRISVPADDGVPIILVGYLLALPRANGDWAGVTARVQNVAVTTGGFFGLESDPGFLRYVTGEVHVIGGFNKRDLVRIDRASFNETTPAYKGIRQAMQDEIYRFKIAVPQRFQRRKTLARSLCKQAEQISMEMAALEATLTDLPLLKRGPRGLKSSGVRGWRDADDTSPLAGLRNMGLCVAVTDTAEEDTGCELMSGGRDEVVLPSTVAFPSVTCLGSRYNVCLVSLGSEVPPITVINSPRRILLNTDHKVLTGKGLPDAARMLIALEIAERLDGLDGRSGLSWARTLLETA